MVSVREDRLVLSLSHMQNTKTHVANVLVERVPSVLVNLVNVVLVLLGLLCWNVVHDCSPLRDHLVVPVLLLLQLASSRPNHSMVMQQVASQECRHQHGTNFVIDKSSHANPRV